MGSGSALDRFLRGLPPPPAPPRGEEKEGEAAGTAALFASPSPPPPLPPHLSPPPPPPSLFIPDRIFEVRLTSPGPSPGWGAGAWCALRISSSARDGGAGGGGGDWGGLSLDSDECSPRRVVAAPWLLAVRGGDPPRILRTSRALAQGAGVAVSARWRACGEEGEEGEQGGGNGGGGAGGTLAVGGLGGAADGEHPPPRAERRKAKGKKLPPLQTLRLAGMTPDEAADLCLDIRSRVAAAAAAAAAVRGRAAAVE